MKGKKRKEAAPNVPGKSPSPDLISPTSKHSFKQKQISSGIHSAIDGRKLCARKDPYGKSIFTPNFHVKLACAVMGHGAHGGTSRELQLALRRLDLQMEPVMSRLPMCGNQNICSCSPRIHDRLTSKHLLERKSDLTPTNQASNSCFRSNFCRHCLKLSIQDLT
jgi:hypothetical protein